MNHNIESLLPHSPPMRMVTEIKNISETSIEVAGKIQADNPFLHDGYFPCAAGIEFLAQAAGILMGIKCKDSILKSDQHILDQYLSAKPGAIVSLKSFELFDMKIPEGAELFSSANYLGGMDRAAIIEGDVFYQKEPICKGSLMIVLFQTQAS